MGFFVIYFYVVDCGLGMVVILRMVDDKFVYMFVDWGIFFVFWDDMDLWIVYLGGDEFLNLYFGIVVNLNWYLGVNYVGVNLFIDFFIEWEI